MWLDWLVFCDCDFQSALRWRRIRGLWQLPDRIDWLRGILGLVLMGRAMLPKSLIQLSVDWWSCVPSLLFTWDQTMVEVMKITMTSFKRSHACTATVPAPNPAAGHCQPMPLAETPRQPQASLLWDHCPFLLGPGTQGSVVGSQESRKSRNSWSNKQIWPWSTEWSRAKANRVLPRACTGHNKTLSSNHIKEDSTHQHLQMVNSKIRLIIFCTAKDGKALYSHKNKTRSWLWLRSWTPYC